MYRLLIFSSVVVLLLVNIEMVVVDTVLAANDVVVPFDANYRILYGDGHHVMLSNQGQEIQLTLDNSSGSGFGSRLYYESGFFQMRIKLHNNDTAGVITTFYLISNTSNHEELDFEFLGNKEGKNISLQTNIYVNGKGNREQRMFLWFNPSADFHTYKILWNQYQIVFYVDDVPIRVLKNNTIKGNIFPTQAMQIRGTIWNGEDWATDGGKTKIDWAHAPFKAHYQGFNINGCPSSPNSQCNSSNYDWNSQKFRDLNATEQKLYKDVRKNYMYYDYCTDIPRFPTIPPECI